MAQQFFLPFAHYFLTLPPYAAACPFFCSSSFSYSCCSCCCSSCSSSSCSSFFFSCSEARVIETQVSVARDAELPNVQRRAALWALGHVGSTELGCAALCFVDPSFIEWTVKVMCSSALAATALLLRACFALASNLVSEWADSCYRIPFPLLGNALSCPSVLTITFAVFPVHTPLHRYTATPHMSRPQLRILTFRCVELHSTRWAW